MARGHAWGAATPCGQKLLAGHAVQLALPPVGLYVPATHGTHAVPSGPVNPGTHVQLRQKLDSAGAAVLAGQVLRTPVQHHVLAGQAAHGALPVPW